MYSSTREEIAQMNKDVSRVLSEVGPDLLSPPHILTILLELLEGDSVQIVAQQEQVVAHLLACDYCRTAVVIALNVAQEYDHRNNDSENPTHDLLVRFASINREIEACTESEYERMGAYAETIIAKGRKKANKQFHTLSEHIKRCRSCRSALEDTLAFLRILEEADDHSSTTGAHDAS
jgi:hypothetical protein